MPHAELFKFPCIRVVLSTYIALLLRLLDSSALQQRRAAAIRVPLAAYATTPNKCNWHSDKFKFHFNMRDRHDFCPNTVRFAVPCTGP